MGQGGTLRKRNKRNIAKVNGLSTIQYNEQEDTFTGREIFADTVPENNRQFSFTTDSDTRIRMSSSLYTQNRDDKNNGEFAAPRRVTRNSLFHRHTESFDSYPTPLSTPNIKNRDSFGGRPNFLDKTTMARLKQLLILGQMSGSFPFRWNSKEGRIDKWNPRLVIIWNIAALFFAIQFVGLTGFQFYVFFKGVANHRGGSYREIIMTSFSVLWHIWADTFVLNMYLYKDEIMDYINTLLQFNKENLSKFKETYYKYGIHLDGYRDGGRLLIWLTIPTNMSQVAASMVFFLMNPFQPWYLISYIYPKPWYWLIPGVIQEFIRAGQVITSYMFLSWIIVAHSNSLEFWLRETHNHYDSDYTKDSLRHPKLATEMYRSLQVLSTCFNNCMAPLPIPLVKFHILTSLLPCGYVVIRSMDKFVDEFPGILTYPIGIVNTAFAGFAFLELCAAVYDLSGGFIDSWSRTRHKDFRRFLLSCPTLKVRVGRCYFITISTTITFFRIVFDFVTDLIITFP